MIRILGPEDAEVLLSCRVFGLQESPQAYLATPGEVAGTPLSQIESELRDEDIRYFGAFDDGALVGFMRYVRFPREARRHVAEVRSVYVRQSVRRRGIGASLLHRLIEEARSVGIESLVLSVLEDNSAACRLYEACGFRSYGQEPRAIAKGDARIDQVLYFLDIREPGGG